MIGLGAAVFPPNGAQGADGLAGRTAVADAAHVASFADKLISYTSLSAPRAVTLPAASDMAEGQVLRVQDESGSCRPWRPITTTLGAGDSLQGVESGPVLIWPYEAIALQSNGSDVWSVLGRSHPRAVYQELAPRGSFIIDDDAFVGPNALTSTSPMSPFIGAVIGSGGGGGQAFCSTNLNGVITAATAVSGASTDRVYLRTLAAGALVTGHGLQFCEYQVGIYTAPDGTNDFVVVVGFTDSIANAYGVDGAWWMIDRSVSDNWLCVTSNNSSRTIEDSGIPWAVANYTLSVEIEADGSAVNFYHGSTLIETIVDTIPSGPTRAYGVVAGYYKKAGTASSLDILALDRVRVFVQNEALRAS